MQFDFKQLHSRKKQLRFTFKQLQSKKKELRNRNKQLRFIFKQLHSRKKELQNLCIELQNLLILSQKRNNRIWIGKKEAQTPNIGFCNSGGRRNKPQHL